MIGHRVRLVTQYTNADSRIFEREEITGICHSLDRGGVSLWRDDGMPEQSHGVFVPMHRIHEIIDLGRAP